MFERDFLEARVFSGVGLSYGGDAVAPEVPFEVTNCAEGFDGNFIGRPLAQIQLSNEGLKPVRFGSHSPDFVIRQYFDPRYGPTGKIRSFTIPLGYKQGFFARGSAGSGAKRLFTWSFAGEKKGSRAEIINLFADIGKGSVYWTSSFGDPFALPAHGVKRLYQNSSFVICPWGFLNPDSFRLTETLESGAIPVTTRFCGLDYARVVFGRHPFIVGRNWSDAAAEVLRLSKNPEELEVRRKEVEDWYRRFRYTLSSDVAALVDNPSINLSALEGEQWRIQAQWGRNLFIRTLFFFYFRFWWFRRLARPI